MATNAGMTSPKSLSGMNVTGLLEHLINNKAYLETVKADPIFANKNLIKTISATDGMSVPAMDQFFINVTPKNTAVRDITLAFINALDMDPIEGNNQFITHEGTFGMKFTKCYANDWAGGVTLQKFGIDARELRNYGLNESAKKLLYQWRQEILGYYAREALVQRYSHNLTATPLSLPQAYNKNWWFPSLTDAQQPAYHATAASHATLIGAAAVAAGMNAVLTPSYFLELIDWLAGQYIMGVNINGKTMYGMLTAPREIRRLRDTAVSGSFGYMMKESGAVKNVNDLIPSAELVVAEKIILIPDDRISTMTLSGNASAYTLTFGYDKAGRTTSKTSGVSTAGASTAVYFYNNIILGAGSLMWYEPEKVHEETQPDEYKQYEGDALFQAIGYQTPLWNDDTGAAGTALQESSCIVPTIKA
jgi:hypothetical protein